MIPELSESHAQEKPEQHLLIVDDDTRIRTLLQRFLSENGYRVTAAKDAAEARQLMTSWEFDFIILDVMMPGEDGFSLTRAIRATSNVPILLLTARGESVDRIEGLERVSRDYVTAPIFLRPTGQNHPRTIFGREDPVADLLRQWAQK